MEVEKINENNEVAISKVIEEISKGPLFEITLRDCFNSFTRNIAMKKELKEMTKIAQASVESERLIRDYQEKIASLEQLNKNLERDLDEASKSLKSTSEKCKKYKELTEEMTQKSTNEYEQEKQKIAAEYEKMLKDAESQMEKYEYQIDELKYELHDREGLNEWMKEEIHRGDKKDRDNKETINKLKKENGQLKKQLQEQNKEFNPLPTTYSEIKKLIAFLKEHIPEIDQEKLDNFLKTYESLHFCHLCKKSVPYTLDGRKRHVEVFHGKDKTVFYKCFPGASDACRCGSSYLKGNQEAHVKAHHYDAKFNCPEKECDYSGILEDMEKHLAEAHIEIDTNDSVINHLISFCFDLSIPTRLSRKDRRRSTQDLSIMELKLEEVRTISEKKNSGLLEEAASSPAESQEREYNPSFEEGMKTPNKENIVPEDVSDDEDEEAKQLELEDFYGNLEEEEEGEDESQNRGKFEHDLDSISLNEEEPQDLAVSEESNAKESAVMEDQDRSLEKYKDFDRPSPNGKNFLRLSRNSSNQDHFKSRIFNSSKSPYYRRHSNEKHYPHENSQNRFGNRLREAYEFTRKRKYPSPLPDENQGHSSPGQKGHKHMRITVNDHGIRYVGNHLVENMRHRKETDFFTKQDVAKFLGEADQSLFCRYFYNNKCKYGINCILIHDKKEITKGMREEIAGWQKKKLSKVMENVSPNEVEKVIKDSEPYKMCQWFKRFHKCRYGAGCWDIHNEHEITIGLKKEIEKAQEKHQ